MIEVRRADLITSDAECILRSVSSNLEPLTAIGREVGAAAGEALLARIEQMGDLPVGGAVITPAGELSASFIVHVALQSYDEPVSPGSLRKALQNGLRHAARMGIETLALPPLGTGAGNLDAEAAAGVMFEVLHEHLEDDEYPKRVTVIVATEYEWEAFASHLVESGEEEPEATVD